MEPTETALRMAPAIREGLRLLEDSVQGYNVFAPLTCDRTFQLLMSDIGELVYLPRILRHIEEIAPNVDIRVMQLPREAYREAFISGEADLAIGYLPGLQAGFYQQRLFSDSYRCIMREDHPRIKDRLTLKQFVSESHIMIETGGTRYMKVALQNSTTTLIEKHLEELGLTRRVALKVPHFMVVPEIVRLTNLVAVLPSFAIKQMPTHSGLKILKLPFDVPEFEVKQFWHQRSHDDPANRWLRSVVAKLFLQD
ncbi:hypothetical protein B9Z36_02105 [Limnohabitans sp. Rim8]|uniref:LysR substrate-binding domain-containing protein n=1 Tax=Limnohabitans sp. Rim8 TaxID=1100718 RepID=UPI000D33B638|nr:LysR substrate-binding domain-containing protein [Limnohabitans sp. Rim8]PUE62124.1 hypothetical protein B9Z36_02105 [Limnohabitans sp. Rim8]